MFEVEPRVLIDNTASRTHSVIEVNGRDRPGLLFDLAKSLKDLGLVIHSAHISTYGERVVDVFYVKDVFGLKIAHRSKMQRVQKAAGRGAERRMSVGRAALTVGGLTALSRVAGFARDLLIAAALGAGPVADAFFVSLKLANFLRRLFAEGAFAAAFVPLYGRLRAAEGPPPRPGSRARPWRCWRWCWPAWWSWASSRCPGWCAAWRPASRPGSLQYELAVELGRITFPYLLLISLAALFASAAPGRPALRRRRVRPGAAEPRADRGPARDRRPRRRRGACPGLGRAGRGRAAAGLGGGGGMARRARPVARRRRGCRPRCGGSAA